MLVTFLTSKPSRAAFEPVNCPSSYHDSRRCLAFADVPSLGRHIFDRHAVAKDGNFTFNQGILLC